MASAALSCGEQGCQKADTYKSCHPLHGCRGRKLARARPLSTQPAKFGISVLRQASKLSIHVLLRSVVHAHVIAGGIDACESMTTLYDEITPPTAGPTAGPASTCNMLLFPLS